MRLIDKGMITGHTNGMKIAISVPDDLCAEVDQIAKKSKIPRSRVFVIAVREQLKDLESKCLLESLNEAYSTSDTPAEVEARLAFQRHFFENVLEKDDFEG